jgi:hypothetical protein
MLDHPLLITRGPNLIVLVVNENVSPNDFFSSLTQSQLMLTALLTKRRKQDVQQVCFFLG